ncbi:MAG: hypothetical protein H8E15_02580 [Planctomycetes bacterium]|nr:hypothetical protein [Planctomycetota bacterium]
MSSLPSKFRRNWLAAALGVAAISLLPTSSAYGQSLPLAGIWSGVGMLPTSAMSLASVAEFANPLPERAVENLQMLAPSIDFTVIEPPHGFAETAQLQQRFGGFGLEWSLDRRVSVGMSYRRGFENIVLDPVAEIQRGTFAGIPVDDRLVTQSLAFEIRINF